MNPDDLLRLLVITRLPFAVPDDPLELARQEQAAPAADHIVCRERRRCIASVDVPAEGGAHR